MSDIITRLLLKTDDFDAKLTRSKAGVNSYQNDVSSMAKTAGAGVAKFAGAIGLAVGAGEGFMKVIRGSQATSDEFDNVLNTCTSTVNSFFTSLSTGDFSAFNQGLSDMMSKAYAASAALDQLGNTRMAYNYFGSGTQTKIAESALIAMDKSLPKEERQKGLVDWKSALDEKKGYSTAMKDDALDALKKIIVEGTVLNSDNVTLKDFENITKLDLYNPAVRDKEKDKLDKFFSQYQSQMKDLENQRQGGGVADWAFPESAGAKERASQNATIDKAQEKLNERFKESILYKKILDKWSDEELQGAFNLASEYQRVNEELAIQERTYNKARDKVNKEGDSGGNGKKEAKSLAGSLAYFDAEIAKKNKELINATTAQARTAVQIVIDELEAKKINLKIELDKSVFKELHGEMKGGDVKMAGIPMQGIGISKKDIKNMKLPKFKSPISEKDVDINRQYAESLGGIGSAFGITGQMAAQFGNEGMAFALSSVGTIAQMIVQLQGLAMANGVANAMALPFPANLAAIATVAGAVTSIFASIPKFETGGIVPGSSFAGDNVLARVNSGEMILNAGQQGNLFRMLNGQVSTQRPVVGNISNLIMPSGETNKVEVFGRLVAKGTDLETVITNRVRKTGKKLW